MPHIHTNPGQHDLTVTAYVVRLDQGEPKGLLHMHRKLGKLVPVGGHVELNETPWQALSHELKEESGYELDSLQIIQPVSRVKQLSKVDLHPYPLAMNTHDVVDGHFHTDISYGLIAHSTPQSSPGEGESLDLRWLTLREIEDLSHETIFENTKQVYGFFINEALKDWEAIAIKELHASTY